MEERDKRTLWTVIGVLVVLAAIVWILAATTPGNRLVQAGSNGIDDNVNVYSNGQDGGGVVGVSYNDSEDNDSGQWSVGASHTENENG